MDATPTPTVADLVAALSRVAPLSKAAGWDPVGLQIGDPAAPAGPVGVAHEVTSAIVDAAVADGLGTLIAYHPLLFRATRRFVAGADATGRAFRLAAAGVALVVVHTAYDVAPGGTADALAAALGLRDVVGFGPAWGADTVKVVTFVPDTAVDEVTAAMAEAGAGVIGNYTACSFRSRGIGTFFAGAGTTPVAGDVGTLNREPEVRVEMVAPQRRRDAVVAALVAAHPYEEPAYDVYPVEANAGMIGRIGVLDLPIDAPSLAALAAARLETANRGGVRFADAGKPIARVAVVPGSGGDFVEAAARMADAIVTGDVPHHTARRALELGLTVVDAGHIATERPGLRRLYASVGTVVPEVVDLGDLDPDPWQTA